MSQPLLESVGLSMRFGALVVTDNVSFRLTAGARHALIGPNGAGKSTLVNLLTGVLRPVEGRILLQGEDVTNLPAHQRVRRGLARTFQINSLFPQLSVLENVYLAVSETMGTSSDLFRRAVTRREVVTRADELIDQLGLGDIRNQPVAMISYGKQRIVEICLALALNPKVLLLDEPAAGVPAQEMNRVLEVVNRLPAEMAILLIEHDMQIVRDFAREVTVLVSGAILTSGPPATVMSNPEVRAVYIGQGQLTGNARTIGRR